MMYDFNHMLFRGVVLFAFGTVFTLVLSMLQREQHSLIYHSKKWNHICSQWWLSLICGAGSAFVGLVYPWLKVKDANPIKCPEWSHVIRCIAMFVGINEACTKVEFPSNLQLSMSLAVLSVGLWWYFDRTPIGFGMGITVAAVAVLIIQVLVYNQICVYTEKEFSYIKSWLPSIVFSGGITVANIGEQLAVSEKLDSENKSHAE